VNSAPGRFDRRGFPPRMSTWAFVSRDLRELVQRSVVSQIARPFSRGIRERAIHLAGRWQFSRHAPGFFSQLDFPNHELLRSVPLTGRCCLESCRARHHPVRGACEKAPIEPAHLPPGFGKALFFKRKRNIECPVVRRSVPVPRNRRLRIHSGLYKLQRHLSTKRFYHRRTRDIENLAETSDKRLRAKTSATRTSEKSAVGCRSRPRKRFLTFADAAGALC